MRDIGKYSSVVAVVQGVLLVEPAAAETDNIVVIDEDERASSNLTI